MNSTNFAVFVLWVFSYQWLTSWCTPASLEQTCALASIHIQLVVASTGGVTTRFDLELGPAKGRLSSMATGLRVPRGVEKNMVRVAYDFLPSRALIPSRNGR